MQKYWKWLYEALCRKRPELWLGDGILHQDNAPAHKALHGKQFLSQRVIIEVGHPPFSPDLAPNDFGLLPEIVCYKGMKILGYLHPKNVVMTLKAVAQQEFQKCFQQLQHCWSKCIVSQREYFEGDTSQ